MHIEWWQGILVLIFIFESGRYLGQWNYKKNVDKIIKEILRSQNRPQKEDVK